MNYINGILFIIFAPIIGGLLQGIDRKISARMQGRIGPPILQPFYDVKKLLSKEVIVINKAEKSRTSITRILFRNMEINRSSS